MSAFPTESTDLLPEIKAIIVRVTKIPQHELGDDVDLVDSGLLDSMQMLQVADQIEKKYDIILPEERLGELTTPRAMAAGIVKLKKAQAQGRARAE